MDVSKVISVDKDGITAERHDFSWVETIWREKELSSFLNYPCSCFLRLRLREAPAAKAKPNPISKRRSGGRQ